MKVLAAARHPGTAEAVGPVVTALRRAGHEVQLIGVPNDTIASKAHGGSAGVFDRYEVDFTNLMEFESVEDVVDLPVEFAESVIDSFGPDVIFVGCSMDSTGEHMGVEETLVDVGARRSVRTVQMVEFWDVWHPRADPSFASAYVALDEATRDVLKARGAPPDRIAVTGHPGLDQYAVARNAKDIERRQGAKAGGVRSVGYFGQASNADGNPDNLMTLGWTLDALQANDRLLFSKHPRDNRDYSDVLNDRDGQASAERGTGDDLLADVDVCVTHFSVMGLKAALLNIPTVNILLDGDCADIRSLCGGFPISSLGGSYEANSNEDLRVLLARPLQGNAAQLKRALNVDGESTHRVAQAVITD